MAIFNEELTKSLEKINRKDLQICVIGVGTIGLPVATFLAKSGFKVTGLDVNSERVKQINEGKVLYEYTNILKTVVNNKHLHATTDQKEALSNAEVVFVCVPTPLNKEKEINLSILISVTENIIKYIRKGTLLIYESSVSIGTTKKMGQLIQKKTDFVIGKDIGLAYCPERYNPTLPSEKLAKIIYNGKCESNEVFTINKVNRVIGGFDEKSRKLAKAIYKTFIETEIKEVSSMETAEATKLLENIFRDVNIALVNELAKVFSVLNVDIYEVIDAAKTKSFAFLPHYPGAGVGGECIPVDTWYLIKQAEAMGIDTKLMKVTREVNDSMPEYTVILLENELQKKKIAVKNANITILGISYKKNLYDTRLSPTFRIIEILKEKNANVKVCDPVVQAHKNPYKLVPIENAFNDADAIILVTDHDIFHNIKLEDVKKQMKTPIIVDGRKFFDKEKVRSFGFAYAYLGGAIK